LAEGDHIAENTGPVTHQQCLPGTILPNVETGTDPDSVSKRRIGSQSFPKALRMASRRGLLANILMHNM